MYAIILVALLGVEPEKKTVFNSANLVQNDWSSTAIAPSESNKYQKTVSERMLSLRQADSWDKGTVWLWHDSGHTFVSGRIIRTDITRDSLTVYKGTYQVFVHSTEEDSLLLKVVCLRKYRGDFGDAHFSWMLDDKFLPIGVEFLLPLDDSTIPKDEISLTCEDFYYVDSTGVRTTVRYVPDSFVERVKGSGSNGTAGYWETT